MIESKPILTLLNEFLSDLDKSENTRISYQKTIGYWIRWTDFKRKNIGSIVLADLIAYKKHLQDNGRSAATIDNYLSSVRKFYSWLVDLEYVKKDITEQLGWARDRKGVFIKQSLSTDQVFELLACHSEPNTISRRNYAIIDLMSFTGMRCIEITRLNIGDVKEAANSWMLQVHRKGRKEKSGLIHVPYDRIKPIQEYWKYRSGTLSDDQPAFVSHSPRSRDARITPVCISRIIKATLRQIGLDSNKYTAHSLRHTAATLAYFAGSENWEIGRMLGHSNPRQTEHYIHSLGIESADEGKATEKINDYALKCKELAKNKKKTA